VQLIALAKTARLTLPDCHGREANSWHIFGTHYSAISNDFLRLIGGIVLSDLIFS
jgi:hypothetical protein